MQSTIHLISGSHPSTNFSTVNIVFDRVGRVDPITKGMEIAVHWFGLNINVVFWSQHISFILVGCICLTSTRGLLLTMSKFFIWISSPKSSNLIVLFLSQVLTYSHVLLYIFPPEIIV